jgi:hypothetical protein
MNVFLLLDLAPDPIAGDMSLLPVMILLGAVLALSVTFLALLIFFLIRYKRRKLQLSQQTEPTPGIEQLAQPE